MHYYLVSTIPIVDGRASRVPGLPSQRIAASYYLGSRNARRKGHPCRLSVILKRG
jgi:hypothetical protein